MSLLDGYLSLAKNTNKTRGNDETQQGVVSGLLPELEFPISNEELIELTEKWQHLWDESTVKKDWLAQCDENEKYWLGKQFNNSTEDRPMIDNIIFESLETFLPQATRRNPEPVVELVDSRLEKIPQANEFQDQVEKRLAHLADVLKLRLKIKKVARHWSIYLLGVAKVGYSMERDDITLKVIRAKKLILDPDATIDEDGYTGRFIGEYRQMEASVLEALSDNKKPIRELVEKDKGSSIQFIEWWTPEYTCWTLGREVLKKKKTPYWNYDKTEQQESVDDFGQVSQQPVEIKGVNHFTSPRIPYIFLSIFNLGKQPVDDTSLIGQNLSNQDVINKLGKQIDANVDSMNNGMVVSEERSGLTKDQASRVSQALKKGSTVVIPTGAPGDAVARFPAASLPADVFNRLMDMRTRTRDVFGTRGSSPAGIQGEDTVRGKIITKGLDTDRIGGGITEYLEQFADDVYNWFVQLLYVFDPEYVGQDLPKLRISVKEGSLLPKDNVTEANQAIELAMAGKMSLVDLYRKLEDPNPEEKAANVWLEVNAPHVLYANDPRVQQVMMMQQQAAMQQQQMQQDQMMAEKGHETQSKMMDHESKMQQIQAKGQSDQLLAKVKIQK